MELIFFHLHKPLCFFSNRISAVNNRAKDINPKIKETKLQHQVIFWKNINYAVRNTEFFVIDVLQTAVMARGLGGCRSFMGLMSLIGPDIK